MPSEPSWKHDATEPGDLARRKDAAGKEDTEPQAARKAGWKQEVEKPKATAKWKQDAGDSKPAAVTAKWKQEDAVAATAAPGWSKRHKFAALAAGVFATLVALILVVLWLIPPKPACVFIIGAGYEDNLAIPANVYGREGMRELADICRGTSTQSPWLRSSLLKLRQEPVDLLIDLPWDRGIDGASEPTVVVFFALHGGVDSQGAYLLPQDANLSEHEPEKQRLRLRQIISRLGQLPEEKKKVLILDATQVTSHWALGMLHNDFARGLASLKDTIEGVPNLVVLSASDVDQRSWVSDEWRQSIFTHYLLEGLKGAADRDGSMRVNALELHQYVAENVEKWVRTNRGTELQTPVLLGGTERAAQIELVVVQEYYQPPDAAAVPAFSPPDDLQAAWKACQRLEKLQPPPAAYAPVLWRRYLETLLRYDALVRAGDQRKTPDLRRELVRLEEDLVRAQALELPSAQNSVNLPLALGFASPWSDRDLAALFNELWKTPPVEQEKKWKQLQAQATDKASRQVLQQKLAGLLVERAAENPAENLAPATNLLHVLCGKGNYRPSEAHFLAMLRRDLPQPAPPAADIQLALRVRRQAEDVALGLRTGAGHPYSEQVYPWIKDKVQEADAKRRAAEDRLFATDAASWDLARKDLQQAQQLYHQALTDADAVRSALQLRNEVLTVLPYYARWVASRRTPDDDQVKSVELLGQEAYYLARQLESASPERIGRAVALDPQDLRPQTIPAQTEAVKRAFQSLRDQFTEHCRELRNVSLPSVWRDTESALAVPEAGDVNLRLDLMTSARMISRTFHLQSAEGRMTEAAGIDRDRNSEQARTTAQRQGRMALAVLDRRWFNDPLFAGVDSGYLQVQNRLQSFATEERWWVSLGLAGEQIGQRLRKLPAVVNQRSAESRKLAIAPAAERLVSAEALSRQVDGALTPLVSAAAAAEARRVRLHDFLLAQADRTLHDHWFAEEPGNEPYYRFAGNLYVEDAKSLVEGGRNELTPQERKARLEPVAKMQERVQLPGTLTAVGPGRLDVTSEPELTVEFRLQADPKGWVPPGFPVLWLETGKLLTQPEAAGRLIREVGGGGAATPLTFRLLPQADGPPPRVPKVDGSTATLRGLYRGQRIDQHTPVSLHRLPHTVVYHRPPQPTGGLAVTADAAMHELFGPANGAIAIVLDGSGSMIDWNRVTNYSRNTPCRYHTMTGALRKVLEQLPKGVTLSVMVYGQAIGPRGANGRPTNPQPEADSTITFIRKPSRWSPIELAGLMEQVEDLSPWNETPIVRSMVRAKEEGFPKDFRGFKTLMVLTDGMDTRFSKDAELHKRHNSNDIPRFLEQEFKDSGVIINLIGFQIAAKEEQAALAQFKAIEKLPLPGKMLTVADVPGLAASLEKGLKQRLRFQIEHELGGILPDMPEGGWDVSRTSDNNRWVKLEPGAYKVRVLTNRVVEQRVQIGRGDFLLLGITPDGAGFERVLFGDDFRYRTHREDAGWLLTNLQNQLKADRSLEMMLALENRSNRKAYQGTLRQVSPREVWLEVKPQGSDTPVALRWGALGGYPAPAFDIQSPAWPTRSGAAEPARSVVTAYYNAEESTPIAASIRRPANLDFTAAFTNQEAQTGLDAGDKSVVESVTVEELPIETRPGVREKLPCLVVRLRHPPGKPVWVVPEGLEQQGQAPGHEHRFYDQANKYTGVFWPVTRDAALNQLRALHLVALDRFKQSRTTARIDLKLEDLPDSRTRPKSVPELIDVK